MTPFEASENPPVQMQLVTYRTALIIRMLEHLYPQLFATVLKEFFQKFQGEKQRSTILNNSLRIVVYSCNGFLINGSEIFKNWIMP